ncbi:Cation/H+ exchanger [Neofusicoccum parvum]|uniref:Cation/H+ exchanger n=1 Tax=Neofusicoccum parvum TaxID=310453 RepID=A0ACB5SM40_9PEZI|nr:Cation/H+ exchanger [Neofusicoccum parvum]
MPELDLSELNIVISVLGAFLILYSIVSSKIKNAWYLGEALPATVIGIILGPVAAKFIDSARWGTGEPDQQNSITLGLCRVVIGIQLVMVGYQLPAKYQLMRWKEKVIGMLPVMTIMWLCTSACIYATIPKLTLLASLVIGSCVACTDPILSQAIAKGPFADKYVPRHLREIISSEAGANDSFAFPSLMLATFLIRHAAAPGDGEANTAEEGQLAEHAEEVGRIGGGVGVALQMWVVETWLYTVFLGIAYGIIVGYGSCLALKVAIRKKWIENDTLFLFPTIIGLFIVGTCGAIGTDDLIACFAAGNALNWNGLYLEETEARRDEVNSSIRGLLNFGAFMYIGSILPWSQFNAPQVTGITYSRLFGLGFLVLIFRRIPATMASYKLLPKVCSNAKEALFMGYFGPIGIGGIFFAEHARHLFPELGEGDQEESNLIAALAPTVYWLVLFSIIVHGLSVPALDYIYRRLGVPTIQDDPIEIMPFSKNSPFPRNSDYLDSRQTIVVYNRFSRGKFDDKQVQNFSWVGTSERKSSLSDDEESLKGDEVKCEAKEMV